MGSWLCQSAEQAGESEQADGGAASPARRLSILHSREAITGPGPGKAISASSQAARHSGDGLRALFLTPAPGWQ